MKTEKDLFDLLKSLEQKQDDINCIFSGDGYLDTEITMIWELIEEKYNIKKGDERTGEILFKFSCGEISKKVAISNLKKISK